MILSAFCLCASSHWPWVKHVLIWLLLVCYKINIIFVIQQSAHSISSPSALHPGPAHRRAPPPSHRRPQGDALLQLEAGDASRLVQLLGAAARGRNLHGVAELGVVHRVHAVLLGHRGHEALPPQDLLRHVRRPGLRGDARGLHHPLQHHDHLDVLVLQVGGGQLVQGAVLVDHVADDEGGHEEDAVGPHRVVHVDVDLVQRNHFALLGGGFLHHLHPHGAAYDHALPPVADADHEAQHAVPDGDDRVHDENERLGAPVGLRGFHEDAAEHDGVDDQTDDVLHDQDDDGGDALLRDHPAPEADGHLDLNGEEEGGGEGVDVRYARDEVVSSLVQVAVREGDEPPDHPEEEPAAQEGHGENDERVEPF